MPFRLYLAFTSSGKLAVSLSDLRKWNCLTYKLDSSKGVGAGSAHANDCFWSIFPCLTCCNFRTAVALQEISLQGNEGTTRLLTMNYQERSVSPSASYTFKTLCRCCTVQSMRTWQSRIHLFQISCYRFSTAHLQMQISSVLLLLDLRFFARVYIPQWSLHYQDDGLHCQCKDSAVYAAFRWWFTLEMRSA